MRTVRNLSVKVMAVLATALAAVALLIPAGSASALTLSAKSNIGPTFDDKTPYEWVSYFRQLGGLNGVSRNSTLEAGVLAHVKYLANHAQSCETNVHDELLQALGSCPANPYATSAGKAAANNSDITRISSNATPRTAISNWFVSAFHALVLLDPKLATTGYASYYTSNPLGMLPLAWPFTAGVDVYRGRTGSYGGQTLVFPASGAATPLTTYRVGTESPEPFRTTTSTSPCHSWGSLTTVSAPLIVQWPIGAQPNMSGQIVDVTTGKAQPTCTLTPSSYPSGSLSRTFLSGANGYTKAAFYYAKYPFAMGHTYRLVVGGTTASTFTVGNLPGAASTSVGGLSGAVKTSWTAPSAGTGTLKRFVPQLFTNSTCTGTPAKSASTATTTRTYTFTGLTHGKVYYTRVVTQNTVNAARSGQCIAVKSY